MPGPDKPPPAGPRGRQPGVGTVYQPPPTGGAALRGELPQELRRVGRRGALGPILDEATQMFDQPTRPMGGPTKSVALRQQVPGGARYGPATAKLGVGPSSLVASRGRLTKVGVWSVVKVSLAFYFCVFVVVMVAGAALWNVAEAAGAIEKLDKLVRSLFALSSFRLHPLTAFTWGGAAVGALCLLGVLANVVASVIYNLLADLLGGVRVTVVGEVPARAASLAPASRGPRPAQRLQDKGL